MCRQRLDYRDKFPEDILEYLEKNGWSFSKKMYEYAVRKMKGADGNMAKTITRDQLQEILQRHNISIEKDNGYDSCYVYCMLKSDYGNIITDEAIIAKMTKAYIDDPDGYDGLPFTRYYADLIGSGRNIPWEDLV